MRKFANRIWATPFFHGLFVFVGGALTPTVYQVFGQGNFPHTLHDLMPIGSMAAGSLVIYLFKNGIMGSSNIKDNA
jgi:hypothetical protein